MAMEGPPSRIIHGGGIGNGAPPPRKTAGADVNAANDHGVTPLALACENRSAGIVEKLLVADANPNLAQVSGLTPLMIAARVGTPAVVRALLAKGADVNAATALTRQTPL